MTRTRAFRPWALLALLTLLALPVRAQDTLTLTGSIALGNLMAAWVQAYDLTAPPVPVAIATPGSAAGIRALLQGTADLALLGEPLPDEARRRFEARRGHPPQVVPVAMDGVAVFVNALTPLRRITLPQLDAAYSATRRCGAPRPVRRWQDLGVDGSLAPAPVTAAGLNDATGAHRLFRRIALCGGDFRPDFVALTGPAEVAALVSRDETALAFAGSALRHPDLRPLAIARKDGGPAVLPTEAAIQTRRYPLARTLAIAFDAPPGSPPPPAIRAFLDYLRSPAGQAVARRAGYVPLPADPR